MNDLDRESLARLLRSEISPVVISRCDGRGSGDDCDGCVNCGVDIGTCSKSNGRRAYRGVRVTVPVFNAGVLRVRVRLPVGFEGKSDLS